VPEKDMAKSKISARSAIDEEFEEKAGLHPDDLFQGDEPVAFTFTDVEWAELCKFRIFDLTPAEEELTARQVMEDAVGKYVVQEVTGANSESVIRLLRKLVPPLEQIKPIVSELKTVAGMIDREQIFNGFGEYQYGSAIDESYFEHFELFNNLMNRCYEEVNRPLTGRKNENAVALVRAIDKLFCNYSSMGKLRRKSKGLGNNDVAFVQIVFEIATTRFSFKEVTEGSIENAMKIAMKKSNDQPMMAMQII
jgi:hypothetical protein